MLANSKFDALTFGRTAREIAVLCDQHSVPCGAPEDLAVFLRALDENKLLAMEFWSLVARGTERNPRATTDPTALLTAIVEAVTAQTLAEFESAGAAQRLLVKRTAGILAGEDIHAPIAPGPIAAARDIRFPAPETKPAPAPPQSPLPPQRQQLRLVLDPEPPPAAEKNAPADLQREAGPAPFAIPLSAYAEAGPDRHTLPRILTGILVLAVIGCGWFAIRHNPSPWHRANNAGAQAPSNSEPQPPHATPQPQTPQAQAPVAPPPIKSAQPQPTASALLPKPAATSTASPANDRNNESDAPGNPQVVVPEEVMRQNLISSRVPVAPDPAAAHGIVVLQAVITSRGTVQHLRVVQGDPTLRRAAIDAAATWHYRPYLLNGTPIDVSTTISVDFSGND